MKKVWIIFGTSILLWAILSLVFIKNELESDGYLEYGVPLVIYRDYNGKGVGESLGFDYLNFTLTVVFILVLSVIVRKILAKKDKY